jgi:hypothetical protein
VGTIVGGVVRNGDVGSECNRCLVRDIAYRFEPAPDRALRNVGSLETGVKLRGATPLEEAQPKRTVGIIGKNEKILIDLDYAVQSCLVVLKM